MKKTILLLAILVAGYSTFAQSKDERLLVERTYLLSHTIFGTKDSLTLEDLFARKSSYGHSGGAVQTREEAVSSISKNRSVYTDTALSNIKVMIDGKTAIVRHLFKAKENKVDGSMTPLNFTMMLVWVKEKGVWRLAGRQAVKLSYHQKTTMQLIPYLIFPDGNCEEALNFYGKALGGQAGHLSRYGDAPGDNKMGMAPDKIMHTQFMVDGNVLFMASDGPSDASDSGNVSLSLNFTDSGSIQNAFTALGEGGTVTMPLQDTFWGATFGMLKDKYGIKWMVNYDKPGEKP